MRRRVFAAASVLLTVLFSVQALGVNYSSSKFTDAQAVQEQFSSGDRAKVIVVLDRSGAVPSYVNWKSPSSVQSLQASVKTLQNSVLSTVTAGEYNLRYRYENLAAFSAWVSETALEQLISHPKVRYVQPVVAVERATAQGLPLMNAVAARSVYDGSGIAIAIVDDAVDYNHPSLGGGGFPNDKVIGGYDFGSMDEDPAPVLPGMAQAHGTSVAGVAAGSLGEMEDYVGGAAPGAKIYALKFSNDVDGSLTNDGGAAAWDWCITHQYDDPRAPILVISNSWSVAYPFQDTAFADMLLPLEAEAAARCAQAGMTVVAASGNDGYKNGIGGPAACSNTIGVGAVSDAPNIIDPLFGILVPNAGMVMPYSNSGTLLDVFAPADCTYTTDIVGANGYAGGDWTACFNGTSCATPYASGMIAILQQACYETNGRYLTPAEVLEILNLTGQPVTDLYAPTITRPLIDLGTAVTYVESLDLTPPTPNPMTWAVEPRALGMHTLFMKGGTAQDATGVEYYIDCETDPTLFKATANEDGTYGDATFDSGWVTNPLHYRGGYATNTTYYFRIKARDLSPNQNETAWSAILSATPGVDVTLYPEEGLWEMFPARLANPKNLPLVGMKAAPGYGEFGAEVTYQFDCTATTDTRPADTFDSLWRTSRNYSFTGVEGKSYTFRFRFRSGVVHSEWSPEKTMTLTAPPKVFEVPNAYPTIQDAIDAAVGNRGDTVLVHPGEYDVSNLNFDSLLDPANNITGADLNIRICSENPSDPAVVAATILNCVGDNSSAQRAFLLDNGEGRKVRIEGFTIRNATANNLSTSETGDGFDAFGGAILCGVLDATDPNLLATTQTPASPTIRSCVFENCSAIGQAGLEEISDPNNPPPPTTGGWGKGGALYGVAGSKPLIENCEFTNCTAIGGSGVSGGCAYGGAFYFEAGCQPELVSLLISNCYVQTGAASGGSLDSELFAHGNDFGAGGGAIYFDSNCQPRIEGVAISNCQAVSDLGQRLGGATYWGPNCSPFIDAEGNDLPILQMSVSDCSVQFSGDPDGSLSEADKGGAEYYATGCALLLEECIYVNNTAGAGLGGGLYLDDTAGMRFTGCRFEDGVAFTGAGVYFNSMNTGRALTFTGCQFSGNTANQDYQASFGGGLYLGSLGTAQGYLSGNVLELHDTVTLSGCEFDSNVSPYGGAICADAVNLVLEKNAELDQACTFTNNEAQAGAAVYVNVCDLRMDRSNFYYNSSNTLDNDTEFCSAGGIHLLNSSFLVTSSHFAANTSAGFGGAVLVQGPGLMNDGYYYDDQRIVNCLFNDNTAQFAGGAVSAGVHSLLSLENCTLVDNQVEGLYSAGGALDCYGGNAYVINSILWGNTAEYGPQVAVGDPLELDNPISIVTLDTCAIEGGTDLIYQGEPMGNASYFDIDVISDDPNFAPISVPANPTERTFYLSQRAAGQLIDSPCLSGYGDADDLNDIIGFAGSTRTDHAADLGDVAMGYHVDSSLEVKKFVLTTRVFVPDRFPHGTLEVTTQPNNPLTGPDPELSFYTYEFTQGTVVELRSHPDAFYRVGRWVGADVLPFARPDNNYNTVTLTGPKTVQVEFEVGVPKKLYVPESYNTIEAALRAARDGDRIVLAPRPDQPYLISDPDGLDFGGMDLVMTSEDPNDPLVVAQTIIDCQGSRYVSKRAFHFHSGETNATRIEGITIRNAFTAVIGASGAIPTGMWPMPFENDPDPLPPARALSGADAYGDSFGGAVLIENNSSPVFRNCVFENCTVSGGIGGDGAHGTPLRDSTTVIEEDYDSQSGGHSGFGSGDGYGGAIAVLSGNPKILYCQFRGNRATGGWGGIPGNAGRSYENGRYGWGGNDSSGIMYANQLYGINLQAGYGEGDGHGGAIYVAAGSNLELTGSTFEDNYVRTGYVSEGGLPYGGSAYPEPWDADPWADDALRTGRDGILFNNGLIAGGAIYFQEGSTLLMAGCAFNDNQAYVVSMPDSMTTPLATRGGAIYTDPNVVLTIAGLANPDDPTDMQMSTFTGNLAGAIYCSEGVTLTVDHTEFINNTDLLVETDGLEDLLELLTGETVSASEYALGGAITVEPNALDASLISHCRFYGNSTTAQGGAIRTASDMVISNSVLNGNQAEGQGGALYGFAEVPDPQTHTIQVILERCELSGNISHDLGGGLFTKNCLLELNDTFLVQNRGTSGGGLRATRGRLDVTDCVIYENVATGIDSGSHRTANGEGYGGGMYISDLPYYISGTRFERNQAIGIFSSGGGLCVRGSQTYYDSWLFNCLFAENASEEKGGGAALLQYVSTDNLPEPMGGELLNPRPLIENCTFANNLSGEESGNGKYTSRNLGGGLYVDRVTDVDVVRSIFSGNKGLAIYEQEDGNTEVAYCLFYKNTYIGDEQKAVSGDLRDADGQIYPAKSAPGWYTNTLLVDDPKYTSGSLGAYYLYQGGSQSNSPAVDPFSQVAGYPTAGEVGVLLNTPLDTYTTDPNEMPDVATSPVDLGFHYRIPNASDRYLLTTAVVDADGVEVPEAGTLVPASSVHPRGAILELTADIKGSHFLTSWAGGTFDDNSQEAVNWVLMSEAKDVRAIVRFRQTLRVGGSPNYQTLGLAIDDAQDGDIILVSPGQYTAPSQFPSAFNTITLDGKALTISGTNPDDESIVRSTVFRDIRFVLNDLNKKTIIEGITLDQSRMLLTNANPEIRNCVFSNCRFNQTDLRHSPPVAAGTDGYHQVPILGGAITMFESSPQVVNCTFENNWVLGADGEDGFAGDRGHPNGGDGGWPGAAYGGAVYCGFSSRPVFTDCTFTGNQATGGNGGNGANYVTIDNTPYLGGRGGGWVFDDAMEELLITATWDGWVYNNNGTKYTDLYYLAFGDLVLLGQYDLDVWSRWFSWDESYTSWDEMIANPPSDPYDQMLEPWRFSGYGGAVYCSFESDVTFRGCVFENNQSYGGLTGVGGSQSGDLTYVDGVPVPDRQLDMPTAGGAVYAAFDSDLVFENCVISNNLADRTTVELPHTIHTAFGGGVAYEHNSSAIFRNCQVSGNVAANGGGIWACDSVTTIADCNVIDNESYAGAGMYLVYGSAEIKTTDFQFNHAKAPDNATEATASAIGQGGGLFASNVMLDLKHSVFRGNLTDVSGGGLMLSDPSPVQPTIHNCLFDRNSAGRDGGGASVYWYSRPVFTNCTFVENRSSGEYDDSVGSGGGLYTASFADVEVWDSIFWMNDAVQGSQITIGSGFEHDPRPSSLTIDYSDVDGGELGGIFRGAGCTLTYGVHNLDADPMFVDSLYGGEYFLDQVDSPCVDAGSRTAMDAMLSSFTTSVNLAPDRGAVDMGYHYSLTENLECSSTDIILDGIVELGDLAELVYYFWSGTDLGNTRLAGCSRENDWCGGADLNSDGVVELQDYMLMANCWLEEDTEAPTGAKWISEKEGSTDVAFDAVNPLAIPGTQDRVAVKVTAARDNWFPDTTLEYYFDCTSCPDLDPDDPDNPDSGWLTYTPLFDDSELGHGPDPNYAVGGLELLETYTWRVLVRDPRGNTAIVTDENGEIERPVTVGVNWTPQPNPSQWDILPVAISPTAVRMTALALEPVENVDVRYEFRRVPNWDPQSDYILEGERYQINDPLFLDDEAVTDTAYTYDVRAQYVTTRTVIEDDGTVTLVVDKTTNWTDWSEAITVTPTVVDVTPPTPNPAQWAAFPNRYSTYHLMEADVHEDADSGPVWYKFVCVDFPGLYSEGAGFSSDWQLTTSWTVNVGVSDIQYEYYFLVSDTPPSGDPEDLPNNWTQSSTCMVGQSCANLPIIDGDDGGDEGVTQ